MGTRDWSPQRWAAHQAAFPPAQRDERNRQAQADYRARNRKRIELANTIRAICVRQKSYGDDERQLASALKQLFLPESIAELVKALTAPMAAGGKKRTAAATPKLARKSPKRRPTGLYINGEPAPPGVTPLTIYQHGEATWLADNPGETAEDFGRLNSCDTSVSPAEREANAKHWKKHG